jgi:uncharacterized membrane protein affecting hemolysin expression
MICAKINLMLIVFVLLITDLLIHKQSRQFRSCMHGDTFSHALTDMFTFQQLQLVVSRLISNWDSEHL